MKAIRLLFVFCVAGLIITACVTSRYPAADTEISLRKSDVLDIPAVPLFKPDASDPGENRLLPRAFDGAPPQVSHTVGDMEISRSTNDCLDCHSSEKGTDGEPAISAAHYADVANTKLKGEQYFCLTCHVEQFDAKPLVRNTFAKK